MTWKGAPLPWPSSRVRAPRHPPSLGSRQLISSPSCTAPVVGRAQPKRRARGQAMRSSTVPEGALALGRTLPSPRCRARRLLEGSLPRAKPAARQPARSPGVVSPRAPLSCPSLEQVLLWRLPLARPFLPSLRRSSLRGRASPSLSRPALRGRRRRLRSPARDRSSSSSGRPGRRQVLLHRGWWRRRQRPGRHLRLGDHQPLSAPPLPCPWACTTPPADLRRGWRCSPASLPYQPRPAWVRT